MHSLYLISSSSLKKSRKSYVNHDSHIGLDSQKDHNSHDGFNIYNGYNIYDNHSGPNGHSGFFAQGQAGKGLILLGDFLGG